MFVGNSHLSLVAALKDVSNTGAVPSMPKHVSFHKSPNLSFDVFRARNSRACFVKGKHLSPLRNSKIVVSFLVFLV